MAWISIAGSWRATAVTLFIRTMGSHHPLGVSTGPGWKLSRFVLKFFFAKNQNNLAFHPGPVQPPGGEGSPLKNITGILEEQQHNLVYVPTIKKNRQVNYSNDWITGPYF